jgi:hypothetical protein
MYVSKSQKNTRNNKERTVHRFAKGKTRKHDENAMRRRRSPADNDSHASSPPKETNVLLDDADSKKGANDAKKASKEESIENVDASSFCVAKWAILRMLGMVYLMAFLGALFQNRGLIGVNGLQPATEYMSRLEKSFVSPLQGFQSHPTLFWWLPLTDSNMDLVAILGIFLSLLVLFGINSWLCMLFLWLLDFSIVTINEGTSFYSYGWESQLLETGFLAIFLCDLPHIRSNDKNQWKLYSLWRDESTNSLPSSPVLWLFRWLCFRISLGAGLIKVRGSSCWASKTCLHYHFETQPIPSPLSFVFHFLPKSVLTRAVDLDLCVQLYTSWLVLVPSFTWYLTILRRVGGFLQAGFMVNIILSGNFAFLNHLTMIPALACLDDKCWPTFLRNWVCGSQRRSSPPHYTLPTRPIVNVVLVLLIGSLSLPVMSNLIQWGGSRQLMNASFDRFRLVNTYGAFGNVGTARYEPILSVSHNGVHWVELELPCKPGDVTRQPCFCAPYHYRLDWNIWFLGFKPHRRYLDQRETWLFSLVRKLLDEHLEEQRPWLDLLDSKSSKYLRDCYNSNKFRPAYAKVDMYKYKMAGSLWSIVRSYRIGKDVIWWERKFEESLIPPVRLDSNKRLELASKIQ